MATAAALPAGLADDEFWDGEGSVRLITWVHVAVTGGFLAVVLGVTARALGAGSPHARPWGGSRSGWGRPRSSWGWLRGRGRAHTPSMDPS